MGTVTTLPRSGAYTRSDLAAMPDDGRRHELIDGTLIVTPAPLDRHQQAVVELVVALHAACTPDCRVRVAPYDVTLAEDTVVQPDVLVARRTDLTEGGLPTAPLLAVEVLSPSTRLVDLNLKRARYEAAGCPSYWVVDPDAVSLTAWESRDGAYVEVCQVTGDETFATSTPYDVRITPSALFD